MVARSNRPYWTLAPVYDGSLGEAYHLQWPSAPFASTLCMVENPLPIKTWEGGKIDDEHKCKLCMRMYRSIVTERILNGEPLSGLI